MIKGYMNVYRSGYFHREGKPGGYNRHAGDFYPTEAAAKADIEPLSHYICTVAIEWPEEAQIEVNAADSKPVPLAVTRQKDYRKVA